MKTRPRSTSLALGCAALVVGACARPGPPPPVPSAVVFDTATAWIFSSADSTALLVEVASTEAQQEVGLAGRDGLDDGSGMWFRFDAMRTTDDGFWMWRTPMPLDVAFLDPDGVVLEIVRMAPCGDAMSADDCPGYFPAQPYASALEVAAGWFTRHGIGVGARVEIRSGDRR